MQGQQKASRMGGDPTQVRSAGGGMYVPSSAASPGPMPQAFHLGLHVEKPYQE